MRLDPLQTLASIALLRRVLVYAESEGIDRETVLAAAVIDPRVLEAPSALVPLGSVLRIYAWLAERLAEPCVGLRIAERSSSRDYGVIGYVLANHLRLVDGLRDVARVYEVFTLGHRLSVEGDDDVRIALRGPQDAVGLALFAQDILGFLVFGARELTGAPVVPLEVELVPPPGADLAAVAAAVEAAFGVSPRFDTAAFAVTIRGADARLPLPAADPGLLAHLHDAVVTMIARRRAAEGGVDDVLRFSNCVVDLVRCEVHRDDARLHLTTKEAQILRFLAGHRNAVVPHVALEREVWGLRPQVLSHAPAVAIRRLRQKIELDPSQPQNLVTVFGEGWKLNVV